MANNGRDVESNVNSDDWQHEVSQGPNCGCIFPFLLIEGMVHLSIYIYKLVDDSRTVLEYWEKRQRYALLISASCLLAPTLIYAIYEVLRTVSSEQSDLRNVLTKLVKGILLIPWQIKGHCEMLAFSADKVCQYRELEPKEQQELSRIKQETFVFEFFEDFYSGFIQLLLQLHFVNTMSTKSNDSFVIYSEIIGSTLAVLSLIKALQRRDDGCLTKTLSFIGWVSYCASRALAFALLSSALGGAVVIGVILSHTGVATALVFKIIKDSHCEERERALKEGCTPNLPAKTNNGVLVVLAFFLFGLPSIMYWPMMFVFKRKLFVFCFLSAGVIENLLCTLAWFIWKNPQLDHKLSTKFALAVIVLTALGTVFIVLYTLLKPELSDRVVLSHILETNSNRYGIFYDFCKAVHVLRVVKDIDYRREQLQRLRPELISTQQ
ncbi:uncharacterized protein LOC111252816 [Varroa destructor]|uniref:XK-related protein n=1 Tax=Varroa destructor TaxID=109461 RepID=A0A7M7MIH5_VARDE|nr:uncharacterized protein LOC111252816 [Varroa destructor]